jgi:hypothetical protein
MRTTAALLLTIALCGRASQASRRRADGMPSTPDAAKLAEAQCRGDFPNDDAFGLMTAREIEPCRAQHGYLVGQ